MNRRLLTYGAPALAALLVAGVLAAQAQEPDRGFSVVTVRAAEGLRGRPIDLRRIAEHQARMADLARGAFVGMGRRVELAKVQGHRSGLPGCERRAERTVRLAEPVPVRFRGSTLYFVSTGRGGLRPGLLPGTLPEGASVFVLESASLNDVIMLAKTLRSRVPLASAEFARAMGVRCADAVVTFSGDGRTAHVREDRR